MSRRLKSRACVCPAWGVRFSKLALRVLAVRAREAAEPSGPTFWHMSLCVCQKVGPEGTAALPEALLCLRGTHCLAHVSLCVPKIGFSGAAGPSLERDELKGPCSGWV